MSPKLVSPKLDRVLCAECQLRHMLFRVETRWPGYYLRPDHAKLDDKNWKVFVNSRYDAQTGAWRMSRKPYIQAIG